MQVSPPDRPRQPVPLLTPSLPESPSCHPASLFPPPPTPFPPPPLPTHPPRRYESFWLPLVAATRSDDLQKLTPPLDVAWVWFVHRLDPMAYRVDCMKLVKKELDTTHFPGVEKLPLALPRLAQSVRSRGLVFLLSSLVFIRIESQ